MNSKQDMAVTVLLGAAAAAGSVALLGLYASKRNQQDVRRAKLQCDCGKVQAEIFQPAANYKYMDTTNMQCGCNDCVGFCQAVFKAGNTNKELQELFFDPGVPQILLYDSEILLVRGSEHLEHMKLSRRTENRRVYAKCCGTPIAVCPDHSHLNLVYCPSITPMKSQDCHDKEVPFPPRILDQPTLCMWTKTLFPPSGVNISEDIRAKYPDMKWIPGMFAPLSVLGMVSRLCLLLGMGARGPGKGFPVEKGKQVGIGYDSIV